MSFWRRVIYRLFMSDGEGLAARKKMEIPEKKTVVTSWKERMWRCASQKWYLTSKNIHVYIYILYILYAQHGRTYKWGVVDAVVDGDPIDETMKEWIYSLTPWYPNGSTMKLYSYIYVVYLVVAFSWYMYICIIIYTSVNYIHIHWFHVSSWLPAIMTTCHFIYGPCLQCVRGAWHPQTRRMSLG